MKSLTHGVQHNVSAGIRAGGFPLVAAQAFGVSAKSYRRWRKLGRSNESLEPFRSFRLATDEAIGQARLRAEVTVFDEQPRYWLLNGPGRETPENPGWTVAVKPCARSERDFNPLLAKSTTGLFHEVLAVLAPHPDLREAVSRAIDRHSKS